MEKTSDFEVNNGRLKAAALFLIKDLRDAILKLD